MARGKKKVHEIKFGKLGYQPFQWSGLGRSHIGMVEEQMSDE